MFESIKYNLSYTVDGKLIQVSSDKSTLSEMLKVDVKQSINGKSEILNITLMPEGDIILKEGYISLPFTFKPDHKIYANGYQSWTDSREFSTNEKIKGISFLATPIIKKYQFDKYGDYSFIKYSKKEGNIHGFTYSYIRDNDEYALFGSLSEKYGFTIIEEKVSENTIHIYKDCEGLKIDKEYPIFQLLYVKGTYDDVFDEYFNAMGIAKRAIQNLSGWTSWYNYYQNITEDIILENLNSFKDKKKKIDVFQIDDGYQTAIGDWLSIDYRKFPRGMTTIAEKIKVSGYKAGIWLAPFVCEKNSEIFRYKPEWLLRDDTGELIMAGSNWSGFYPLDIYNNEVRANLKHVFDVVLNEWGYDMVKLDFLYAVCLVPRKDKTRGQIMVEAIDFLRECVGDKLILACGVPLGPTFGKVDFCRIGCDVGLDWDDKWFMRLFHRERVSTINAINNTIGRRHLNGRAFLNDPDVFLLRDHNIMLTHDQKETLLIVNRLFGSIVFTSDNIKDYDAYKDKMFDYIMRVNDIKIIKVTNIKKDLIEVLFREDGKDALGVFNLGKLNVRYDHNYALVGAVPSNDNIKCFDSTIHLMPYQSLVFHRVNKI